MGTGSRHPVPRGAGLVCPRHRALPWAPVSTTRLQEHSTSRSRFHPLPAPRRQPERRAQLSISRRAAPRHPARAAVPTARGPSTPAPATATLTGLHGEEEEEEGGGTAPAAGGHGPGARQPGHGVAGASAGCGTRCSPGAYVGHAPSRPARPRRRIDWWKLGPAVAKGTAPGLPASHPASHPDPQPGPAPRGAVAGRCAAARGRRRAAPAAATAAPEPHAGPRPFVPGSLHSGHSSVASRSPRLMGIHAGSSPSPWHPRCRQELPALFPAFAAKRPPVRPVRPPWPPARPDTSWGASLWGWGPPKAPVPQEQAGVVLGEQGRGSGVSAKWC